MYVYVYIHTYIYIYKVLISFKLSIPNIFFFKSNVHFTIQLYVSLNYHGFPGDSEGQESACNAGDPGSISELGRFAGEGNDNRLQYSCLEISMDTKARGAATVHSVTKIQT